MAHWTKHPHFIGTCNVNNIMMCLPATLSRVTIINDIFLYPLQSVEGVLGTNNYQHNKVNQWTSAVVEQCLNQLTKLAKPFKYIGMSLCV